MKSANEPVSIKQVLKGSLFLFVFFVVSCGITAQSEGITEEQIRDAVLGKTPANVSTMDLNKDGKVDVADVVYVMNHVLGMPIGEHAGTMYRSGGDMLPGVRSSYGQIPFVLNIKGDNPLTAEIDNTEVVNSLYFPSERLPVTISVDNVTGHLSASVTFETRAPNLAPDTLLTRTVTFSGTFVDPERRLMRGTYEERIAGMKDSMDRAMEIRLTGQFTLVFNRL